MSEQPRVVTRMPEQERKRLFILAAERGESVQDITLRAIRAYVQELETEEVECGG